MTKSSLSALLDELRGRLLVNSRRAYDMLGQLIRPTILDIGCGSGVPTLELAKISGGQVVGMDINVALLRRMLRKRDAAGLKQSVAAVNASLLHIPFKPGSFELLWSEGSVQFIGLAKALYEWRPLIKPGGYLVIHESEEVINAVGDLGKYGYRPIGEFLISGDIWWSEFFEPMESRLGDVPRHDQESMYSADELLFELTRVKEDPGGFNSQFLVLRRLDMPLCDGPLTAFQKVGVVIKTTVALSPSHRHPRLSK